MGDIDEKKCTAKANNMKKEQTHSSKGGKLSGTYTGVVVSHSVMCELPSMSRQTQLQPCLICFLTARATYSIRS